MTIKTSIIKMSDESKRFKVEAPYHPDFPARAKNLGGKFNGENKAWYFDPRDEERVRAMLREIYGTDGETMTDMVTIHVPMAATGTYSDDACWVAGRCIAKRSGRDWPVQLGEGVVLISGGFPARGGSAKYPALHYENDTVLEIRDVPHPAAEKAKSKFPSIKILAADAGRHQAPDAEKRLKELVTRKEALEKELAFIDEQIKVLTGLQQLQEVSSGA